MIGAATIGGVVGRGLPPAARAKLREIRGKAACVQSKRKRKKKPVQPHTTTRKGDVGSWLVG